MTRYAAAAAVSLLLFFLAPAAAKAERISWRSDLAEAQSESVRTTKPLFVLVTAGIWCDPCEWFNDTTMTNASVVEIIQQDFIPYRVYDVDAAARNFPIDRVPCIYIFRPGEDEPTFSTSGPVSAEALVSNLQRFVFSDSLPAVKPPAVEERRYEFNGGQIVYLDGTWRSRDAGLPPDFELYEEDDAFFYLRNVAAGVLLAVPRETGGVWRWDQESREWVSDGEARLLPQ